MLFRLGLCSLPPFPLLLPAKTGSEDEYFPNYVDVALQAGLTARTVIAGHESKDFLLSTTGGGIALFDYDNDGWLDIFVVNGSGLARFPKGEEPTNHLYRNNHDGTFTDVTAKANLARSGWGQGVCVGDYNNDGFLDLFVTYYGKNRSEEHTSELQSRLHLVCRLLLEKKKTHLITMSDLTFNSY